MTTNATAGLLLEPGGRPGTENLPLEQTVNHTDPETARLQSLILEREAEIATLRDLLGKENQRANAAIDREETAEQAAIEARQELDAVRAAVSAVVSPPTSRAELRDRIRRVLCERDGKGYLWGTDMLEPDEYGDLADAVLAVLPEPTSRAAVLLDAADRLAALRAAEREWLPATGLHKGEQELRRLAAEAQQQPDTEAPRAWCRCRSCWGWFVEDHPGEDLDELGRDLSWWSGLPEHRDAPAEAQQPDTEAPTLTQLAATDPEYRDLLIRRGQEMTSRQRPTPSGGDAPRP